MSDLVEKVAKAMHAHRSTYDNVPYENEDPKLREVYEAKARAAIKAVAEWLEKDCGDEWFKARHLFAQLKEGGE